METEYNFCLNSSIDNLQIHFNQDGEDSSGYNQWSSDDSTYSINWDTSLSKWKLNGVEVTIKNDKIGNKRITWYSQDVFEYNKEIFFRRGKRWVSEKSTLIVAN